MLSKDRYFQGVFTDGGRGVHFQREHKFYGLVNFWVLHFYSAFTFFLGGEGGCHFLAFISIISDRRMSLKDKDITHGHDVLPFFQKPNNLVLTQTFPRFLFFACTVFKFLQSKVIKLEMQNSPIVIVIFTKYPLV